MPPTARRFPPWLLGLALAAVTLAVYRPAIDLPWCGFDDGDYILGNASVKAGLSLAGLRWAFTHTIQGHWNPLTVLSLMLDMSLFGVRPDWVHFVNVSLHAASAGMLAAAIFAATGEAWPSLLAAALWALHPLRVQSVVWAAERKDVLSLFFTVATVAAYLRFARSRPRSLIKLAGVHLLYVCALLSKATPVTLPFVLLLLDYWPLRRTLREDAGALIREKAGLFALAAATSIAARFLMSLIFPTEVSVGTRLQHVPVAYVFYLARTLRPSDLSLYYPYPALEAWSWAGAALLLTAITAAAWRARRKSPATLVGWLWFLGTFIPMIGLVQLGGQWSPDRYAYLPHIGLAIAVVWAGAAVVRRWPRAKPGLAAAAAAALAASAWATRLEIDVWSNPKLLYERSLARAPDHFHLNNLLGHILADEGDLLGAERLFRRSISSNPSYPFARANLGLLWEREGRLSDALPQLEAAVRMMPNKTDFHMDYALALERAGKLEDARRELERAIELDPREADPHSNLGNVLFRQGRAEEAAGEYREALRLEPDNADAHNNLGIALAAKGDRPGAIAEFTAALRLRPGFELARRNLALAASADRSPIGFGESLRWR